MSATLRTTIAATVAGAEDGAAGAGVGVTDLVDRYALGDCASAWTEACSTGQGPELGELATLFAGRALDNLRRLHRTLQSLGYQFLNPDLALVETTAEDHESVRMIEAQFGGLPLVVRAFYSKVKSVDFRQVEEDGDSPSALHRLGEDCTLVFLALEEAASKAESDREPATQDVFLPLGPYASNCEPIGIWLPEQGLDCVVYDDGKGTVHFADHLRLQFRWGGFPRWQRQTRSERRSGPAFDELLPKLRHGLLDL